MIETIRWFMGRLSTAYGRMQSISMEIHRFWFRFILSYFVRWFEHQTLWLLFWHIKSFHVKFPTQYCSTLRKNSFILVQMNKMNFQNIFSLIETYLRRRRRRNEMRWIGTHKERSSMGYGIVNHAHISSHSTVWPVVSLSFLCMCVVQLCGQRSELVTEYVYTHFFWLGPNESMTNKDNSGFVSLNSLRVAFLIATVSLSLLLLLRHCAIFFPSQLCDAI